MQPQSPISSETPSPGEEQWRPIADFDGYEVSDMGRVRSGATVLKPRPDRNGYLSVTIRRAKKAHRRVIQRLVAEAFIGPRPDGMVVRHRNGIESDNRKGNLRYGTPIENEADKIEHGTQLRGDGHHQAKLTAEQVIAIRKRFSPGSEVDGQNALAREFGVSDTAIYDVLRRDTWTCIAASADDKTPRRRLTPEQIADIRSRYQPKSKEAGLSALAREFGVSAPAIHYIVKAARKSSS
jgi:hypothetical protein